MKQKMKRIKAAASAVVLGLLSVVIAQGAQAETVNNVKYIDADGSEKICDMATRVNNEIDNLTAGWWVVDRDVSRMPLSVNGSVYLILSDGNSLTVEGVANSCGLGVSGAGNSLTVYSQAAGTGKLTAIGDTFGAGIGGGPNAAGSNITINGGIVTATGGQAAAGIGGGRGAIGSNITINGGMVMATGGDGAAGIGSGNGGGESINVFAANNMIVKVGAVANPTEVISHLSITMDIASALAGKRYATANPIDNTRAPDYAEATGYDWLFNHAIDGKQYENEAANDNGVDIFFIYPTLMTKFDPAMQHKGFRLIDDPEMRDMNPVA